MFCALDRCLRYTIRKTANVWRGLHDLDLILGKILEMLAKPGGGAILQVK